MLYLANPCGPKVVQAMCDGLLGLIDTPLQRKATLTEQAHDAGVAWCADNGCFSNRWDESAWWRFLEKNAHRAHSCLFATLPDVVGDARQTGIKSLPWIEPVKALGYKVAWVAQDGQEIHPLPWHDIDCLFIGGTTEWKLGPHARNLAIEAKRRGKWVHMGRVNSGRRYRYALAIGCDSVDGTFLTFGPDVNLPRLLAWTRTSE